MAKDMERLARKYKGIKDATKAAPLPLVKTLRLGINMASCDSVPLVIVNASSPKERAALEKKLAALAWSDALIGRAVYAAASTSSSKRKKDLKPVKGAKQGSAFLVVQPDRYGLTASVLAQIGADVSPKELLAVLERGIAKHRAIDKSRRDHVRQGKRDGVNWETEIPVTDPGKGPGKGPGGGPPPGGGRR